MRAVRRAAARALVGLAFAAGSGRVTLDEVLAAALRANRDLRVARAASDSARAEVRDAERQVTLAVCRAFYDVLLADARRALVADRRPAAARCPWAL